MPTTPTERLFFWQLVQGAARLDADTGLERVESTPPATATRATLHWTPTVRDRADSEVLVRVIDSRGGVALRRFTIAVDGANHAPTIDAIADITLLEGEVRSAAAGGRRCRRRHPSR